MLGDQLSKYQDRALHRAFESAVLAQFPNPERKDCPGTGTLRAIANKRISMRDPALAHVGQCSPCLAELTEMRQVTRHKNLVWMAASATVAVVVLLVLAGPYLWRNRSIPISPQAQRIAAVVDLRNASASRTAEPRRSNEPRIETPRGLLALTVVLPIGAEAGIYDLEIRKPNQSSNAAAQGLAAIENGVTVLHINIDTRPLEVGDYEIAWRQPKSDWRSHPVFVQ